jgi:hypothetical protein
MKVMPKNSSEKACQVYDLKISPFLLFFVIASWLGSAMAAGHCKPDEITYFSCAIKGSEKT